ncbi:MAG: hypothetical protein ACE5FI_03855 [Anaerolineales bacterium]
MFKSSVLKKRWPIAVAVLALVGLACTCSALGIGDGGDGGGSEVAGVTEGTRITVSNTGSEDVCYVYVSPASDDAWGNDQLGSATISPGSSHGFGVDAGASYDLRADDCSDRNVAERFDVTVGQDQNFEWNVAAGQSGVAQVTLVNNGSTPVCFVNFSLSSEDSWGPDRLATESIIDSGSSVTFFIEAAGEHDFRALDCDRNTISELFNEQINPGDDLNWETGS